MLVNPIHLNNGAELSIHLDNSNVILRGSVDESAGVVLRGSVVLNCHENIKIKTILLKFQGKSRVEWLEGHGSHQRHYKEELTVAEHNLTILPLQKKAYHFASGNHHWEFEVPLPGDLPETITTDLGQITYRLKAVAERPTFSSNLKAVCNVHVNRTYLPSSLELNQSMVICNEWADKLAYNISIPCKILNAGAVVPVTYELVPLSPDITIASVTCLLKEYMTLSTTDHSKTEGRLIKKYCYEDSQCVEASEWAKTECLNIPSRKIVQDITADAIKVKHKLKFVVSLINGDGHISELRASIPVVVAPIVSDDDANELPAYEDTWRSLPYEALHVISEHHPTLALNGSPLDTTTSRPNTISSESSSISDDDALVEPTLFWQTCDLSRVPSYTTAIRSGRFLSVSGSLPTYESVASVSGKS